MCEKIWLYFEIRRKTESVCSQGLHGSKQNPALSDSFLQVFEWFCVCFFLFLFYRNDNDVILTTVDDLVWFRCQIFN